jgi:chromosome segregation ATPase
MNKLSGLEKMNKKLLLELEELEALLATEDGGITKLREFISKLESDQKQLQRDAASEKDTVASLENQNRNLGG